MILGSIGIIGSASSVTPPLIITYSVGSAGNFGTGANNGSNGGNTSLTILGITITGNGGGGGQYNNNVAGAGGTASGGDYNITGGTGMGVTGDTGGGGGGGIGGANNNQNIYGAGKPGSQSLDVYGLFNILNQLSIPTTSPGAGGSGNGPYNTDNAGSATGFGCGGGGAGWWGGNGGNGLYGGGGGGASGGTATLSGGMGGSGAIVLSFTGGTPSSVILTSGTSYTVPAGTTAIRAWAIGGGGGGGGVPPGDGFSSGGGGSGGVAVRNWNLLSPTPAPSIVSSGLILHLDAGNPASYPGSGTTWTDLSGNGNNAVASGSPTYVATNGGGFNFDNATDYFDITPNMRESYASAGLSVAAWVKATSFPFPYVSTIMARGDWNNNNGWALQHSASSNTISGPRSTGAVSNSFAVNVNILYYVIFTISPSGSAKMYINGVQNGSTSTGIIVPTASPVSPVIGNYPVNQYPWVGDIYQIHVYNRELSSAEIAENFWVTKFRYGL